MITTYPIQNSPSESIREKAMNWWNQLTIPQKRVFCYINSELIGTPRDWESLTGREIESLYLKLNSRHES